MKYTQDQLDDLISDFRDDYLYDKSENTALSYSQDARNFMEQIGFDTDGINRESISKYVRYGKDGTRKGAAASQVKRRASIKAFLEYMHSEHQEEDGNIDPGIVEKIRVAQLKRKMPEFLTAEETARLIESFGTTDNPLDIRNRAMMELMYSGGLRVSELIGLNVGQINTSDYVNSYLRVVGKGGKERKVIMSSIAARWVHRYLDEARPQFTNDRSTWLFVSRTGQKLSRNVVWGFMQDGARKAGIPPERVHPHIMRHCFATHLIQNGANIRFVQELLGHERLDTTQVYTAVLDENKADAFKNAFPRQ